MSTAAPTSFARDPFAGAATICQAVSLSLSPFVLNLVGFTDGLLFLPLSLAVALFGLLISVRWFPHPFRVLGLVPPATLLFTVSVLSAWLLGPATWNAVLLGFAVGVIVGAEIRYSAARSTGWEAGKGGWWWKYTRFDMWLLLVEGVAFFAYMIGSLIAGFDFWPWPPYLWEVSVGVSLFLLVFSWIRLFRPFFELCVEAVVWRGYHIAATGPGSAGLPAHGPLLVIANHACWWDPLFVAKVVPRPITPMMTSVFYDKWFLRPLMVYVFQTIRVAEARVRREAPEIKDAIRALDEGKCVVIFPEGYLRRKEEVPLRRFGRGVWEILKARPNTPVVACWIEGGWGSYASYAGGPPTKNKPRQRRRPITVGVSTPFTLPAQSFEEHLRTRIALMNEVLAARKHLGLSHLPNFELPTHDEKEDFTQSAES